LDPLQVAHPSHIGDFEQFCDPVFHFDSELPELLDGGWTLQQPQTAAQALSSEATGVRPGKELKDRCVGMPRLTSSGHRAIGWPFFAAFLVQLTPGEPDAMKETSGFPDRTNMNHRMLPGAD